jgi:hypothetical protein
MGILEGPRQGYGDDMLGLEDRGLDARWDGRATAVEEMSMMEVRWERTCRGKQCLYGRLNKDCWSSKCLCLV